MTGTGTGTLTAAIVLRVGEQGIRAGSGVTDQILLAQRSLAHPGLLSQAFGAAAVALAVVAPVAVMLMHVVVTLVTHMGLLLLHVGPLAAQQEGLTGTCHRPLLRSPTSACQVLCPKTRRQGMCLTECCSSGVSPQKRGSQA